jgi:hypothetical protein
MGFVPPAGAGAKGPSTSNPSETLGQAVAGAVSGAVQSTQDQAPPTSPFGLVQQLASGNTGGGGGFFSGLPGIVGTGGGTGSSGSDTFGNFLSDVINPLGALGIPL